MKREWLLKVMIGLCLLSGVRHIYKVCKEYALPKTQISEQK